MTPIPPLRLAVQVQWPLLVMNLPIEAGPLTLLPTPAGVEARDEHGIRWSRRLAAPRALFRGEALTFPDANTIHLVDPKSGEVTQRISGPPGLSVDVEDDCFVAATYSGGSQLYLVRGNSPALAWKWIAAKGEVVVCGPSLSSSRVHAALSNGVVVALKRETGEEVWRNSITDLKHTEWGREEDGCVIDKSYVFDQTALFSVEGGWTVGFRAVSGEREWSYPCVPTWLRHRPSF